MMNFSTLSSQLVNARRGRNGSMAVNGVLMAIILLLAVKVFTSSDQVVLTPSNPADGMVARGNVDRSYIEALAKDAVYALYNASPGSSEYGRRTINRVAHPQYRAELLDQYDKTARDIVARRISTVFTIFELEHNNSLLEVVVSGELRTFLETTPIATEQRRIYLKFERQAGSVRLSKIGLLEQKE